MDAAVGVAELLDHAPILLGEDARPLAAELGPDGIEGGAEEAPVGAGSMRLIGAARAQRPGQGKVVRHAGLPAARAAILQVIDDRAEERPVGRIARRQLADAAGIGQAGRRISDAVNRIWVGHRAHDRRAVDHTACLG